MMIRAYVVTGALAAIASLSVAAQQGGTPEQYSTRGKEVVFPTTVSPDVPRRVIFAGDTVDLDRYDMWERFDQELTSIIYSHYKTMMTLKRANRYFPVLAPILAQNGVPQDFLYMACAESLLDPLAVSPAKAAGMWQFMASTAREYGLEVTDEVDERYDPEKATVAACGYLKRAYEKYHDWATVAASYNAGMGRISGQLTQQEQGSSFDLYLNSETSRYVFRILSYKMFLHDPKRYGYKIYAHQLYQPYTYTTVEVAGGIDSWTVWAREHGCSYARLRELNPWIRSHKLTNATGKSYVVRVPDSGSMSRSRRSPLTYNPAWVMTK